MHNTASERDLYPLFHQVVPRVGGFNTTARCRDNLEKLFYRIGSQKTPAVTVATMHELGVLDASRERALHAHVRNTRGGSWTPNVLTDFSVWVREMLPYYKAITVLFGQNRVQNAEDAALLYYMTEGSRMHYWATNPIAQKQAEERELQHLGFAT